MPRSPERTDWPENGLISHDQDVQVGSDSRSAVFLSRNFLQGKLDRADPRRIRRLVRTLESLPQPAQAIARIPPVGDSPKRNVVVSRCTPVPENAGSKPTLPPNHDIPVGTLPRISVS